MRTLSSIAPEFAAELICALEAQGHNVLAGYIATVRVESCTFNRSGDTGYIYFVRSAPSKNAYLTAPVAATISFSEPHWFNVDVDHDGYSVGDGAPWPCRHRC